MEFLGVQISILRGFLFNAKIDQRGCRLILYSLRAKSQIYLRFSNSKAKSLKSEIVKLRDSQALSPTDMYTIVSTGYYSAGTDSTNVPPTGGDTLWSIQVFSNDTKHWLLTLE